MTMTVRAACRPVAAIAAGLVGIGLAIAPAAAYAELADAAAKGEPAATPRTAPPAAWMRVTGIGAGGSATVACPDGLKVFGVGGSAETGSALTGIVPDEWLATATATSNGFGAVTVYAICGPAMPNLQRVTATDTDGTATASCPKTSRLQGLGMALDGPSGGSLLSLEPDVDTQSARVRLSSAAPVRVYAICGRVSASPQVARASETVEGQRKVVTVACPAGTHVQATSAHIGDATVLIESVTPSENLASVTVTATSQVPGRWLMDATALCG